MLKLLYKNQSRSMKSLTHQLNKRKKIKELSKLLTKMLSRNKRGCKTSEKSKGNKTLLRLAFTKDHKELKKSSEQI
jgi:hypothetical protein